MGDNHYTTGLLATIVRRRLIEGARGDLLRFLGKLIDDIIKAVQTVERERVLEIIQDEYAVGYSSETLAVLQHIMATIKNQPYAGE